MQEVGIKNYNLNVPEPTERINHRCVSKLLNVPVNIDYWNNLGVERILP